MSRHDGRLFGPEQPCFGCGPVHPFGFHLAFDDEEDGVSTTFVPGEHYQGPPGIMHGGLVATLADEIAAWTVFRKMNRIGVTTSFDGRLRAAVRIGKAVSGRGRLLSQGRIASIAVELRQDDALVFEGGFRFALLDRQTAERLIGPLPEGWAEMTR